MAADATFRLSLFFAAPPKGQRFPTPPYNSFASIGAELQGETTMGPTISSLKAARAIQEALNTAGYCEDESSEEACDPAPIWPGHPVHQAMVAFENTLPGRSKPREIGRPWRRLLRCSRNGDVGAFEAAEELLDTLGKYTGFRVLPEMDGPAEPKGLRWKGKLYHEIERMPDCLLKFLWGKESVLIIDAELEVWGHDEEVGDRAFPTALSKVNALLEAAGVPWHYQKRGEKIIRIDHDQEKIS